MPTVTPDLIGKTINVRITNPQKIRNRIEFEIIAINEKDNTVTLRPEDEDKDEFIAELADNSLRDYLYSLTNAETMADKKSFVDEMIVRLQNASDSKNSKIKLTKKQDIADTEHIRLTMPQIKILLQKTIDYPSKLVGLRDCALISLAVATGIREGELVNITVDNLRQTFGGKLALLVEHGKGDKQRLIPYGLFSNALIAVDHWLQSANITSGYVFRSLDRHGNVRNAMTTRAVIKVIKRYPIMIDGQLKTITPHDLRRTYAKLLYTSDMDLASIQQNLGHASMDTTLKYIGTMDADKREPNLSLPIPAVLETQNLT